MTLAEFILEGEGKVAPRKALQVFARAYRSLGEVGRRDEAEWIELFVGFTTSYDIVRTVQRGQPRWTSRRKTLSERTDVHGY